MEQLKDRVRVDAGLVEHSVSEVLILICGHGGRDSRCGALGLPLQREFEDKLQLASITLLPSRRGAEEELHAVAARVGLISHIGGHKWAGNVIMYFPPNWSVQGKHPLSGSAVWYGRVEPKHVYGIVQETILAGRIVQDLWRGGMRISDGPYGPSWDPIQVE